MNPQTSQGEGSEFQTVIVIVIVHFSKRDFKTRMQTLINQQGKGNELVHAKITSWLMQSYELAA